MLRTFALGLALGALAPACTCSRDKEPPTSTTAAAPQASSPAPQAAAPPPPNPSPAPAGSVAAPEPTTKEIHGLRVKVLQGGAIEVVGKDRWDRDFSTTYENADFLRNALPVLRRTLTDQQTDGLAEFVGGAGDPPAPPSAKPAE